MRDWRKRQQTLTGIHEGDEEQEGKERGIGQEERRGILTVRHEENESHEKSVSCLSSSSCVPVGILRFLYEKQPD
jgi:hypothetical protein